MVCVPAFVAVDPGSIHRSDGLFRAIQPGGLHPVCHELDERCMGWRLVIQTVSERRPLQPPDETQVVQLHAIRHTSHTFQLWHNGTRGGLSHLKLYIAWNQTHLQWICPRTMCAVYGKYQMNEWHMLYWQLRIHSLIPSTNYWKGWRYIETYFRLCRKTK